MDEMEELKKAFGLTFGETKKAILEMLNDPEIPKARAAYYARLRDGLIAQGFTSEQAFHIVLRQKSPEK